MQIFTIVQRLYKHPSCGYACVSGSSTRDGITPLHRVVLRWASSFFPSRPAPNPWNTILKSLIRRGANPNIRAVQTGDTPLILTVWKGNVEGARILLEAPGVDLAIEDDLGANALAHSLVWKHWAVGLTREITAITTPPPLPDGGEGSAEVGAEGGLKLVEEGLIASRFFEVDPDRLFSSHAFDLVDRDRCARSMPQYDYSTSGFVMKDVARALSKCDDLLTALPRLLLEAGAIASPKMLLESHPVVFKALKPLLKDVSVDAAVLRAASPDAWTLPRTPAYRHLLKLPRPDPWANATVSNSQDDQLGNVCHLNTVESTDFMNQSVFSHFLKESAPLLIRGVGVKNPRWDPMRRRFTLEWLKANLAMAATVHAGPIPYSTTFDMSGVVGDVGAGVGGGGKVSIETFMERSRTSSTYSTATPPEYIFESIPWRAHPDHPLYPLLEAAKEALDDIDFMPRTATKHNLQFAFGNAGTGAPLHMHASAMNALVAGRKRWVLLPPSFAAYSKVPPVFDEDDTRTWRGGGGAAVADRSDEGGVERRGGGVGGDPGIVARLEAKGVPFATCVQRAGDVILIPNGWAHRVINLDSPTAGAAIEFHMPQDLAFGFEYRRREMAGMR
mmetsp:Transcript_32516/g.85647  ORF Transcript_32516/g.85647 Transcript_32516/m.85647 type:complete len:616 (-) Transcript_32516:86-1933(-)